MINWKAVAKWRDELRSGKYVQTSGALKTEDGHCCLGVFCEGVVKLKGEPPGINSIDFSFLGLTGSLPETAMHVLGSGSFPKLFASTMSYLNDVGYPASTGRNVFQSLTFDEIADLLDVAILEHQAGVRDSELIT